MQSRVPISNPFRGSIATLRAISTALVCALVIGLIACDGNERTHEDDGTHSTGGSTWNGAPSRGARPRDAADLAAIRDRADAAFEALESQPSRGASRIGPQPWPTDLPAPWPGSIAGRVVADTRRDGDRLLLVDVAGEREDAVERYADELRASGFEVESGPAGEASSLRGHADAARAELTFYARESGGKAVTRVEILFPRPASG